MDRAITTPRLVAIAIGSNLGDRHAALQFAIGRQASLLTSFATSSIIETEPESPDGEVLPNQPAYLNAAVSGTTTLDARTLLDRLLAIERDYGRERPFPGAARTLDLDLVLLGDEVIDEPGLQVPHPRFRDRFFVLGPLAEIAPAMVDPVTGRRVGELLVRLLRNEQR